MSPALDLRALLLALTLIGVNASCSEDPAEPAAVVDLDPEPVARGFAQPMFVTAPRGDQRLFIVERAGRIRIKRGGLIPATPFLDRSPGSTSIPTTAAGGSRA